MTMKNGKTAVERVMERKMMCNPPIIEDEETAQAILDVLEKTDKEIEQLEKENDNETALKYLRDNLDPITIAALRFERQKLTLHDAKIMVSVLTT